MRFAVVVVAMLACGRIGFEARLASDAMTGDGAANDSVAPDDDTGTDAMACAYLSTCKTGEATCCTAADSVCTLSPQTCTGAVTACDVTNSAGCGSGAACCIVPPSTQPACYGPFPPPPC
jgi:hypothetical protein